MKLELAAIRVKESEAELRSDEATADGYYSLHKALDAHTDALLEYSRVLRVYTDLVVYGIIPEAAKAAGEPPPL